MGSDPGVFVNLMKSSNLYITIEIYGTYILFCQLPWYLYMTINYLRTNLSLVTRQSQLYLFTKSESPGSKNCFSSKSFFSSSQERTKLVFVVKIKRKLSGRLFRMFVCLFVCLFTFCLVTFLFRKRRGTRQKRESRN